MAAWCRQLYLGYRILFFLVSQQGILKTSTPFQPSKQSKQLFQYWHYAKGHTMWSCFVVRATQTIESVANSFKFLQMTLILNMYKCLQVWDQHKHKSFEGLKHNICKLLHRSYFLEFLKWKIWDTSLFLIFLCQDISDVHWSTKSQERGF